MGDVIRGLYAITDETLSGEALLSAAESVLRGGARVLQYRCKDPERRWEEAPGLKALCDSLSVPFIVNDDVPLAKKVQASGVHLGQGDASIAEARRMLGVEALIGVSCYNDLTRALTAQARGADYVAFGSFFPSPTKPQAVKAEIALLIEARRLLALPIVAIGGITPENAPPLIEAGADALAAVAGLFRQKDPLSAARRYASLFPLP